MAEIETLNVENLREVLRNRPDIITGDSVLMGLVRDTARAEGVVDFGARKRERLERDASRTRATNEALVAMAKANLAAQAQVHSAILAVLEAPTLMALDRKLAGRVAGALSVDVIKVYLEGHDPLGNGLALQACSPGLVSALLGERSERLGQVDARFADALYGDQANSLRSEALTRIEVGDLTGVLCLAARDESAFTPDQGADLLHFFARVLERRIAPHLRQ
jgi:uncharacterized protein YigA (DUF484 family)